MPIDMDDAMRSGAVSARAAKKHGVGVRGPRAKSSEMTTPKRLDEGHTGNKGLLPKAEINQRATQHTGAGMPSKGGGVGSSYVPGRKAIDQFPQKQGEKFPPAASVRGRPMQGVNNTRAKGMRPASSGGPGGGNANNKEYFGGPMPRAREQ